MRTAKQTQAAKQNLKKAQAVWQGMSARAPNRARLARVVVSLTAADNPGGSKTR
jgi:hypothetical protein